MASACTPGNTADWQPGRSPRRTSRSACLLAASPPAYTPPSNIAVPGRPFQTRSGRRDTPHGASRGLGGRLGEPGLQRYTRGTASGAPNQGQSSPRTPCTPATGEGGSQWARWPPAGTRQSNRSGCQRFGETLRHSGCNYVRLALSSEFTLSNRAEFVLTNVRGGPI